ncbi:MAG: patatin-like phospholipase family protein [Solirubrobacterales bacterium]|nr:patatin-like phospholipase family protein [Solirubrobacterales bacterium]
MVLGAGGITGIAWLLGALEAVHEQTGWDPAGAHVLTGTSAGAVAATVTVAGVPAEDLLRMAEDPVFLDAAIARATADPRARSRPGPAWPGSIALGLSGLLSADPRARISSLVGFLPRGLRSGDEIRGLTHAAAAGGWPADQTLLLHACDFRTGRRVSFGAADAPPASLADAVVASCAVPGYYRPVRIDGRDYVDGGIASFAHLDQVAGLDCDLVLCLSPFASRARGSAADATLFGAARRATAWQLGREAATLRAAGTRVVTVEPEAAELRAMGLNPMDRGRSRAVLEAARDGVGARIAALLDGVDLPSAGRPAAPVQAALAAAA